MSGSVIHRGRSHKIAGDSSTAHRQLRQVKIVAMVVELVTGLGALGGGLQLMFNVGGSNPPLSDLRAVPVVSLHSYVLPGLALMVVVGLPMLVAASANWRHASVGPLASVIAGLLLAGWLAYEVMIVSFSLLQIVFGAAAVFTVFAGMTGHPIRALKAQSSTE
jgi:hypothetical protein